MKILETFAHGVMITGFVLAMMLVVEYLNVVSRGAVGRLARVKGWIAYVGAGLLGVAPGCLGSFAAVSLYAHGSLSFGAIVANMIATSGDEAYVMLALFPGKAMLLFALLLAYGVVVGYVVDRVAPRLGSSTFCCGAGLAIHGEDVAAKSGVRSVGRRHLSPQRLTLGSLVALFALAVGSGMVGPGEWGWLRVTALVLALVALGIVLSVSDHFLSEHLYRHVVKQHLPRLALWVFGVLLVMAWLESSALPVAETIRTYPGLALLAAVVLGLIPQSGPHLIFVTLFAEGAVPLSVLAASSAVQDGHGMLPLLAESRREFVKVKAVNALAGLVLGVVLSAFGM